VIFAVLKGPTDAKELHKEMQNALKINLNPLFKIREVIIVESLPRTASNKVMRRVLRSRFQGS
jgi:acetyl-CoA synthetase